MPLPQSALGRGMIIGAGAVAALVVARRFASRKAVSQQLIDWDRATQVALRMVGPSGRLDTLEKERLQREFEELVEGIEGPIAQFTGTELSLGRGRVMVMDRVDWIHANVANFREMLAPLDDLFTETDSDGSAILPALSQASQLAMSVQAGLLLGYLSRKVLGQYDISLLGREPLTGGKLYFVEPNILGVEQALALPARELRLWIALHEATHAHEFEINPWVSAYLNEHLQRYLRSAVEDLRASSNMSAARTMARRMIGNLRAGQSLLESVMTPDQRAILSELQALMALAEGYSNHVMNSVGSRILPGFQEIHDRIEQRQRQRGKSEELFLKLTGLRLKMEQYRLGERFAKEVTDARGIAFLNRAWQSRDQLPSEQEIGQPALWIARLERAAAGAA